MLNTSEKPDFPQMAKIQGLCDGLCPDGEIEMRLHFYGLKNGQKNVRGILVKQFTGSALPLTSKCRTVEYPLEENALPQGLGLRLRREIVFRMFDAQQTANLLEPIRMFLAYNQYHLYHKPIELFPAKIYDHCLTEVLFCHKTFDEVESKNTGINFYDPAESVHPVVNFGLPGIHPLPVHVRQDPTFKLCFQGSPSTSVLVAYPVPWVPQTCKKQLDVPASYLWLLMPIDSPAMMEARPESKQGLLAKEFLRNPRRQSYSASIYPQLAKSPRRCYSICSDFKNSAETDRQQQEPFVVSKLKRDYLPEVLLLKKFD
ncbi:GL14790 [Drosophila persimilis]|uniref:GL14790 n=1 Tax=Drosophila persimilis TaxID=7234 RepID=B4GQ45_DROPE|nr:GL14790 [Drosophila persimilis]